MSRENFQKKLKYQNEWNICNKFATVRVHWRETEERVVIINIPI